MYRIKESDAERAGSVLAAAFHDDPIWTGYVPDDELRRQILRVMFSFSTEFLVHRGNAHGSSEKLEGVALWGDGGTMGITMARLLSCGMLLKSFRTFGPYMREMKTMQQDLKTLTADRRKHMKGTRYLFLEAIGVDPEHQGKGHGRALLRQMFERADGAGMPVYLETETEKNVDMYSRYGFTVIAERDFPGPGYHLWQMVRKA